MQCFSDAVSDISLLMFIFSSVCTSVFIIGYSFIPVTSITFLYLKQYSVSH